MHNFKIIGKVLCLICVLILCACGSTKFATLKEADCFAESKRVEYKDKKIYIDVGRKVVPETRPSSDPIGTALLGAALLSGKVLDVGLMVGASTLKSSMAGSKLRVKSTVHFGSGHYVTLYRQETGKLTRDIAKDAIEMAGDKPTSDVLEFVVIRVSPGVFAREYQDENSHLIMTKFVLVIVDFDVKKDAGRRLTEEDWKPFVDYAIRVSNNIKSIVEEESRRPSPYCPEAGV